MDEAWSWYQQWVADEQVRAWITAAVVAVVGLVVARLISVGLHRAVARRSSPQNALLVRRGTFYGLAFIALFSALREAGFELGVVLGAAGVLTVALGFASQTSASNIISGLFLLGEQPFVVGDLVEIDGTKGEVVSVDLLSVKIRTFQNLFVRVPNESIIKTQITNLTRYPIRRVDLRVRLPYESDVDRVRAVLEEVAAREPRVLEEPSPVFWVKGFEASHVELFFGVWAETRGWLEVESDLYIAIKGAMEEAEIEIPYHQVVLHQPTLGGPAGKEIP
jgi:small-conductance mechanosensitive channel